MIHSILLYSIKHKLIVLLLVLGIVGFGIYAALNIPIGAVPDITNNQVQVITTSRNLSTEDVEKFLTYPVELEMANLPGVKEIRSISKFGLSVVTIVFEDEIGTYLPRQLIAEKLKTAEQKIPQGFGTPFMGPVSTGLGEIYQYILDVKPGYEKRYSSTDLRTVQDWIVKRQLSGIAGVVEVNTWGGYLKTYEVALDPNILKSLNISPTLVYKALESNNSIAGGGYIEKSNEAFFIRAEGLITSLDDIKNIVVEVRNGSPIFIKDLATVGFGHATRFGAITANGEGEKVMGQVMMLKGASSDKVIARVKERVASIQKTLPEGVYINPILERSELIERTTFTITENLILGCLIVIFVVILLLGNWRSGLVVASVIPLCLLFAISLMYIFGVDANLMSLGAIDFGIIIDGAVIIVEYVAYKLVSASSNLNHMPIQQRESEIDKITFEGAKKMMHSAVFGQVIIILVFIPILSLSGVEGKMFKPMAITFCFALIGAMFFCFTYVPVMSALFIKPRTSTGPGFSERMIQAINNVYQPTLQLALRFKYIVLSASFVVLLLTIFLFSRMGGEFVPTLDEGDFVIQPVLKTGMSLEKTVEMTTRIEKIVKTFPEVKQVVSRIGAAEVPTDPMSMEESDVIITLKPIGEWTTAKTKDELADALKNAILAKIPGIEVEFTQPIEMRFNELITGVRADLAVKIFGDDLDLLFEKASEIKKLIEPIEGAADIILEKTEGLPQMSIKYDRDKIAKYGLNISDLNNLVTLGFAGATAGTIFEGEKQFDLVLKYDAENRKNLDNIKRALVDLPNGSQIPLSEVAEIQNTTGPAKISRDNTRRRIVVGVNVRGRDLQSVVDDVQSKIEKSVKLPQGYTIEYGGQFENLRSATNRLMIAVPISLVLIFILLYFAFGTVRDALIIYTAIPMASVGGILFLYLRGLPFSISAGVGFIALFGIAVLNGIVLIEHFKDLKSRGVADIYQLVLRGTSERLRPVLLTASAAALGFFPMAFSTSAGAEVQKPLATVVIGGLITSTLLTLILLPVLYVLLEHRKNIKIKPAIGLFMLGLCLLIPASGQTQEVKGLNYLLDKAYQSNEYLKLSGLHIDQANKLIHSAKDPAKTEFYYSRDQNNFALNGLPLNVIGANQTLKLPAVAKTKKAELVAMVDIQKNQLTLSKKVIEKEVTTAYSKYVYWQSVAGLYAYLDSIYGVFEISANRKLELGEGNVLEKLTATTKRNDVTLNKNHAETMAENALIDLKRWTNVADVPIEVDKNFSVPFAPNLPGSDPPQLQAHMLNLALAKTQVQVAAASKLPELSFSAFMGFNKLSNARYYPGVYAGIAVPLYGKAFDSKQEAARVNQEIMAKEIDIYQMNFEHNKQQLLTEMSHYQKAIDLYLSEGIQTKTQLMEGIQKAYKLGEIDVFEYIFTIEAATQLELNYLDNKFQYNLKATDYHYLINP
ncbi:MAG: CusA/CzcA family heavy metal efflux RND transporter [Saprospiraceae bacterium]|nr:CusA/CzcA family heavy metal efflux RND transporter [Saprospiraceae bacterium]